MDKPVTIFKIKNTSNGYFSHGVIMNYSEMKKDPNKTYMNIKWSRKGKEWTSEETVKEHLLKVIELVGSVPDSWEIMEFTQQPSKSLHDWIDNKMLVKMLQRA